MCLANVNRVAMDGSRVKDSGESAGSVVNRVACDVGSSVGSSYVVHILLPCEKGDHVLAEIVRKSASIDARLPRIRIATDGNEYFAEEELERKLEEALLFPVYVVKSVYQHREEDAENPGSQVVQDVWVVHAAGDLPPMTEPLKWVHRDDVLLYEWLKAIQDYTRGHVFVKVKALFEDIQSAVERHAKPWEAFGFYKKLMSWAGGVLQRKNMVMKGRIRLLQDTGDSRVFTCDVHLQDDGDADHGSDRSEVIFIKCTFPAAREVERTLAGASVFGDIVPEIIGFDVGWGILMERDAGKLTEEPFDQEALIGTVLYMQRVSVKHISELEGKGLRVMDMEWLERHVESILEHDIFDEYFKSQEEIRVCCDEEREMLKSLRSKTSEIRERCREISKLGLPRTVVHGDCSAHNMGRSTRTREGKLYRIFDWAQAYIGSPLVDLEFMLSPRGEDGGGKVDWEAGVRQICEQWKQLRSVTHEEIRKALCDMKYLSSLFEVYEMQEQFDLYTVTAKGEQEEEYDEHKFRILDSFGLVTEGLGHLDRYMELARQGGE